MWLDLRTIPPPADAETVSVLGANYADVSTINHHGGDAATDRELRTKPLLESYAELESLIALAREASRMSSVLEQVRMIRDATTTKLGPRR